MSSQGNRNLFRYFKQEELNTENFCKDIGKDGGENRERTPKDQ